MNMYTATQGAFVYDSHPLGGKTVDISVMGQQDSTYRCTFPGGAEKDAISGVNRRVNSLWIERQTTPWSG